MTVRSLPAEWVYGGVIACLLVGFFWMQTRIAINHDVAFNLFAAEMILDGKTYPDGIYDINPPLVMLLSIPPVLLAQLASISLPMAFLLYVYGLIVLCLLAVWRAVPLRLYDDPRLRGLLLIILVGVEVALPGYDFGQREHLICIMSVPYLCMVGRRLNGEPASTASTIVCISLMAFSVFLKPYFLLLPAAVFALDLHRERALNVLFTTENVTFLFWGALGGAVIALFFRGYLAIAADGVYAYAYYNGDLKTAVIFIVTLAAPAALCIALVQLIDHHKLVCLSLSLLGLFLFVSAAVFLMQNKTFNYHALPTRFALCLVFGLTALLAVEELVQRRWRLAPVALLLAGSAVLAGIPVAQALGHAFTSATTKAMKAESLSALLRSTTPGDYVLQMSTASGSNTLLMYAGVRPGSRFNCFFELPFIVDSLGKLSTLPPEQAERALRLDRYLKTAVAADLQLYRPTFVLVDVSPVMQAIVVGQIDLLGYFLRDEAFAAQWRAYEPYVGPLAVNGIVESQGRPYRVYRRRPG